MAYQEAEGAACEECGGPVGVGKDGKPFKRCYNCVQGRKKPAPRAAQAQLPQAAKDQKEDYWRHKAELDAERDVRVTRLAVLNSALEYHQSVAIQSRVTPPSKEEVLKTAEEFEAWVRRAKPA